MSNFKIHKLNTSQKKKKIQPTKNTIQDNEIHKKSHHKKKWIIGTILILVSILFIGNITMRALGNISISGMNTYEVFVPIIPVQGTGTVKKIEGTKNILIAGIGGSGHEGSLLTDSIMLASINSDAGFATLISIPRDLFVAYPKGYGTAGKINGLYGLGVSNKLGIRLLAEKVSEITGQPIDAYIVIDFNGFKNIINALGGIEINVPKDLIDREYPNNNWGYEVFSVSAGLQVFDGERALKYARSRHSTSDFDRSARQQLILKGIKEKALSLGILTNPKKISELLDAIKSHIDTSMSLGDVTDLALRLKDIETSNIHIYSLNNECSGTRCIAGSYLYTPSREYFAGASVLIPENASISKLSYYDDIRRFTGFIFRFPDVGNNHQPISIIAGKGKSSQAKNILINLKKSGIKFDEKKTLVEATGSISTSRINIYWNKEMQLGIGESQPIIQALRYLEENITYTTVPRNEYVTTDGPRIEIVIGDDIEGYFTFAKPIYYLPYLPITGSTHSGEQNIISGEKKNPKTLENTKPVSTPRSQSPNDSAEDLLIQPGEWENF